MVAVEDFLDTESYQNCLSDDERVLMAARLTAGVEKRSTVVISHRAPLCRS